MFEPAPAAQDYQPWPSFESEHARVRQSMPMKPAGGRAARTAMSGCWQRRREIATSRIITAEPGPSSTPCWGRTWRSGGERLLWRLQRHPRRTASALLDHFRDLHGLKQDHAEALEVVVWAKAVKDVYLLAHAWLAEGVERKPADRELVLLVRALGEQFAQAKGHPCQALAKRLLRHQDELVLFVVDERVAADNNEAERALRPLVIARKISGGAPQRSGQPAPR